MEILNRLTIKHLLMNKKRTIVTIIGITLSMALMLGCGLLASSFIEEMKQETIDTNGAHHVEFKNLTEQEAKTIENNINVSKSYFYSTIGFADFLDSANESKPYYYIAAASKDLLEGFELKEGRLPENDHEVVISEHIHYNANQYLKVGDTLDILVGHRYQNGEEALQNIEYFPGEDEIVDAVSKQYNIVGIIARPYTEEYSAAGYSVFTCSQDYSKNSANYLFVEFQKPKDTFEIGSDIQEELSLSNQDVDYNSSLLYFYGTTRYDNVNQSVLSVMCIGLTLLSVGCIIVIYNSFAISTMERKKQFGLYSSIGTTKKQILHTVFFEAFLVGTIGIGLGILGSFLGIYIVLQILNHLLVNIWNYHFSLVINWMFIFVPILFMIFVIFFSALIPAKRASRVTPIEAIRENDDIKMPRRKLRTPKYITRLFGIEGELALKNMKRNKKKYRITVLSLFISIVLFISFSTYLTYGVSTIGTIDYYDYDILINSYSEETLLSLKEIQKDSRVIKSYLFASDYFSFQVPYEYYVKEYQEYRKNMVSDDLKVDTNYLSVVVLSDADYQDYQKRIGANDTDIILLNEGQYVSYQEKKRVSYHQAFFQEKPSHLKVCKDVSNCNGELSVTYTEEVLPTFLYTSYHYEPIVFMSESKYQNFLEENQGDIQSEPYYSLQMITSDYEEFYQELSDKYDGKNFNVFSPKVDLKEQQNLILAIKILLYGFISLVSLIGITSVFNTIHTSINLRRKEFAMLRSMGLTPNGFNKMVIFESLFFGLKSLFFGLPVSLIFVLLIHQSMSGFSRGEGILIPWMSVWIAIFGVFFIVLLAMWYSVKKIKKENILNAIRDENI